MMIGQNTKLWVNYDALLEGRQGADPSLVSIALGLSAFPAEPFNTDRTKSLKPSIQSYNEKPETADA